MLRRGNIAVRLSAACCVFLMAIMSGAYAEEEKSSAFDWLQVAAFAGHQSDFSGVFIYQFGNQVETSNIIHVNGAGGEYEKRESLDGPKRQMIRHDGQVWSYDHDKMVQIKSRPMHVKFPMLLPEQVSALKENYLGRLLGMERVAGFNAQGLLFQPKDNLRYAHKMWVDTGSGLLLKSVVLGERNQVVEQYAFTQLTVGGTPDPSWGGMCDASKLPANRPAETAPPAQDYQPTNSGWVADLLPAGFKKTLEITRTMPGKDVPVTQIVYSDGLSAISIFVEPSDEDDLEGLSTRGAVNLYRKIVGQHLITIVGEVPAHTVIEVAESVRFNGR